LNESLLFSIGYPLCVVVETTFSNQIGLLLMTMLTRDLTLLYFHSRIRIHNF